MQENSRAKKRSSLGQLTPPKIFSSTGSKEKRLAWAPPAPKSMTSNQSTSALASVTQPHYSHSHPDGRDSAETQTNSGHSTLVSERLTGFPVSDASEQPERISKTSLESYDSSHTRVSGSKFAGQRQEHHHHQQQQQQQQQQQIPQTAGANSNRVGLLSALRGRLRQFSGQKFFEKPSEKPKPEAAKSVKKQAKKQQQEQTRKLKGRFPSNTERFEAESASRNNSLNRSVTFDTPKRRQVRMIRLPQRERTQTAVDANTYDFPTSASTEPPKLSSERILRRSGENIQNKVINRMKDSSAPFGSRFRSFTDPAANETWKQQVHLDAASTVEHDSDSDSDSELDSDSSYSDSESESESKYTESSSQKRSRLLRVAQKGNRGSEYEEDDHSGLTTEERIRLEETIADWRASSRSSSNNPSQVYSPIRWSLESDIDSKPRDSNIFQTSRVKNNRPFSQSTQATSNSSSSSFSDLDDQQRAYVANVLQRARVEVTPSPFSDSRSSTLRRSSTSAHNIRHKHNLSYTPSHQHRNSSNINNHVAPQQEYDGNSTVNQHELDGRPVIVHQHYHLHYDKGGASGASSSSSSLTLDPELGIKRTRSGLTGLKRFLPTLRGARSFSDSQKIRRGSRLPTPVPTPVPQDTVENDTFSERVRAIVETTHKNDPNLSFSLPVLEAKDWEQISEVLVTSIQAKATEKLTERAKEASAHLARNQEQIRAVINVLEEDAQRRRSTSPLPGEEI